MASVTLHGHGVYCTVCEDVYDSTDGCEHHLDQKAGIRKTTDGYLAQSDDMGHYSPHTFMDINGMETCVECGAVKLSDEMVNAAGSDTHGASSESTGGVN